MNTSCIADGMPGVTEYLDQAEKWFPNKSRADLANILGEYFEDKPHETKFPTMGQLRSFMGRIKKLSRKKGLLSRDEKILQQRREKMIHAFTSAQRLDHTAMIGRAFSKFITKNKLPTETRIDCIARSGGVQGIVDAIELEYSRKTDYRALVAVQQRSRELKGLPLLEGEALQKLEDHCKFIANEYKKIVDNFDALVMEASTEIQRLEEIEMEYYGTSFSEALAQRYSDEEDNTDENVVNGENWNVDYRTVNTQDTMAIVADRVLRNVPLIDDNGNQVVNYIGYRRFVDPLRIHGFLTDVVEQATDSAQMMELIQERAGETPWISALYDVLAKDDIAKTAIFDNYKRSVTRYEDVYHKDDAHPLQVAQQNAMNKRNAALRGITNTMLSGVILQRGTSAYDGDGNLVNNTALKDLVEKLKEYKKDAVRQTNRNDPAVVIRRSEWLKKHPDAIKDMVRAIRSFGIETSEKNIRRLTESTDLNAAEKKRLKGYGGDYQFLRKIEALYKDFEDSIKKGDTPEDFVGRHSRHLREISDILGVVSYDDVENRALVDGKSFMTHTTPNLIRQTADELTGVAQTKEDTALAKEDFRRYLWEKFGKCEGFNIARTQAEIDLEIEAALDNDLSWQERIEPGLEDDPVAIAQARQEAKDELRDKYMNDYSGGAKMIGWLDDSHEGSIAYEAQQQGYYQVIDVMDLQSLGVKKDPENWEDIDHFKVDWAYFNRASGTGRKTAYATPIMADYGVYNVITAPVYETDLYTEGGLGERVYNINSEIVQLFTDEVKAEMQRINRIQKTKESDPVENGKRVPDPTKRVVMQQLEDNGDKFIIFPEMNTLGIKEKYESMKADPKTAIEAEGYLAQEVAKQLEKYVEDQLEFYTNRFLFNEPEFKGLLDKKTGQITPKSIEQLRHFLLNELYAQNQIAKIFFGGAQYYSDGDEYHKRGMFAHAPRTVFDTAAVWGGEKVLSDSENKSYRMAIVEDQVMGSSYKQVFTEIYEEAYKAGIITEEQKNAFIKSWDKITSTDGQAFRSLPSFRQVYKMADKGAWTEKHEVAYNAIMDGKVTPDVINTLQSLTMIQNLKTVGTGFEMVDTGILDDNGNNVLVRQPFLYKHSEAVMLAPYIAEALQKRMPQFQSPILKGLGNFMLKNKIDVVEFHSCVKMGDTGVISADEISSPNGKTISAETIEQTLTDKLTSYKGAIHTVPYKYVGIAASTPVDYANVERSWSSQAIKMAWNDIMVDDTLTLPDGTIIKSQAGKNMFYKIYASNIQTAWDTVVEEFKDPKAMERALQQALASKSYNSKDLKYALSLIKDFHGNLEFAIPLISPVTGRAVQQLLYSIIRNRLGRSHTKGGNLIQQTSLGFDTYADSTVHYTDDTPRDWRTLEIKMKKGKKELDCVEVYMPIHDDRLLEYADETGAISPTRLKELVDGGIIDKRMLEFVAYRTPTDGIHAVIPCRIVGFLPRSSGGNIIMPMEMMVLTGHDYDVDKMLCHFKDFRKSYWNEEKIWRAYNQRTNGKDVGEISDEELDDAFLALLSLTQEQLERLNKGKMSYREFRGHLKEDATGEVADRYRLKTPTISLIEYDYTSDNPLSQSIEARNNAEIELLFANITSEAGTRRFLIPGGFDDVKKLAYTTWILNSDSKQVKEDIATVSKERGLSTKEELQKHLLNQDTKKLKGYVARIMSQESPYAISNRHTAHANIMEGRSLIPRYALYNSGLALLQDTGVGIGMFKKKIFDKNGVFTGKYEEYRAGLCGYELATLDGMHDEEGALKSNILAQLISAAVDNRNNPILSFLNQNNATVDLTVLLIAAGIPKNLAFTVMSQPIVRKYAELKAKNPYKDVAEIFDAIIDFEKERYNTPDQADKWRDYPQGMNSAVKHLMKREPSDLTENIGVDIYSRDKKFVQDQLAIAYLLKGLAPAAQDLNTLIMSLRPENAKTGAGPTVGATIANIQRIEELQKKIDDGSCALTFETPLLTTFEPSIEHSEDAIATAYEENSTLPIPTLLNSLMLSGSSQLISQYMVNATDNWQSVTKMIAGLFISKRVKDAKYMQIQNEQILWKLLQSPELVTDDMQARRRDLVIELPARVKAVKDYITDLRKRSSEDAPLSDTEQRLVENKLISKMWVVRAQESTIPRIQLRLGGVLTEKIVQQLRDAWDELLYLNDTITVTINEQPVTIDIHQMAIDLFVYNLFTDGFGFGQYTIAQMAPPSVQQQTPGWLSTLRRLKTDPNFGQFSGEEAEKFMEQFILNHWYDSSLVPKVTDEVWDKMVKEVREDGTVILVKNIQQPDKLTDTEAAITDPAYYYNHWNTQFIAHKDKSNRVTLYKMRETADGSYELIEYPKLGNYDSLYQVGVQYEPNAYDNRGIVPLVTGTDSSWGLFSENYLREDRVYGEPDINAANPFEQEEKPLTETQIRKIQRKRDIAGLGNPANPFRQVQISEEVSGDVIKSQPATRENIEKQTADSVEHNSRSFDMGTGNPFFNLVRHTTDNSGKAIVQTVRTKATPASVRIARLQQADYELNKFLIDLMAKVGVGVGELLDFEAELGAAGVTDFTRARITAEGLVEMIRVANNEEGQASIPEEFSHLAMAMLGKDNPLVERLMSTMTDGVIREVLGEFYDDYYEKYEGDQRRLAFEASGKLVASNLFYGEPIPPKPYRSLLRRVIDAIKAILRKIGIRDIQYEIDRANRAANELAMEALQGKLTDLMIMDNIEETSKYFSKTKIVNAVEENGSRLERIYKRDLKRYNVLERRTRNAAEDRRTAVLDQATALVDKMRIAMNSTQQDIAINDYIKESLQYIKKCDESLAKSIAISDVSNVLCGKLRLDRDLIYSFSDTLADLRKFSRENPDVLSSQTKNLLAQCQAALHEFELRYHEAAMEQFVAWVRSIMGDEMVIGIGRHKGQKINPENLAMAAEKDINFLNRWLDSMADQPDMLNKIFDEAVRRYKEKVRQLDIDMRVRIDAAFSNLLRETGSRDQSFIYERDAKGKRTGKYISAEAAARLPKAKYDYYTEMMAIKKEIELYLPVDKNNLLRTIKIRKDLLDRLKNSESVSEGLRSLGTAIKDKLLVRQSDEEYLASSTLLDFEGNKVDTVPLYYLYMGEGETEEDMSDDMASTMLAYAHMAHNYKELNGIINILENARSMAQERRVTQRRGRRQEQETFTVNEEMISIKHTKAQKETHIGQMLDQWFQMHVYNHLREDTGTIFNTNISRQKAADTVNEITSLSTMALNLPQRISNVATGMVQIGEEAIAREFFTPGTWSKGTAFYLEKLPELMRYAGTQTNPSYLAMLDEMFDITQENARRFRDREYRKNAFEKNANTGLLTLGLAWGEHLMSMTTGISILMEYKVKDASGKSVPIIEALQVTYKDPATKSGAKMVLKPGYTKEDGSAFTNDDIYKLTKKIAGVNQRLQGIYNTNDKNMFESQAVGVLVMMFRKWMVPSFRRRYGRANYNFMTESWYEGFYESLFIFLANNIEDWKDDMTHLRTVVTTNWSKLTPQEKANITRALTEVGTLIGITMTILLMGRVHMEDDKEGKGFSDWLYEMTMYQLYRLRTEVGAMSPNLQLAKEAGTILAEPFAGMRVIENALSSVQALIPSNWKKEVKSGKYKGHSYGYRYLMNAPVVSIAKTVSRAFDQSDLIEFYKRGGWI